MPVVIGSPLTFEDVVAVAVERAEVELPPDLDARLAPALQIVEDAVTSGKTIYGVTTGFGGLSNVRIDPTEAARLQRDIVLSHATAVGTPLPSEVVRAMMLLRRAHVRVRRIWSKAGPRRTVRPDAERRHPPDRPVARLAGCVG